METELIPAINESSGLFNLQDPTSMGINLLHHNVVPVKSGESGYALMQRPTFTTHVDDSVTGGFGRGIMERNGKILRVDQGFYHYGSAGDGSSADITGLKGTHDGAGNAAILTDSTASWVDDQFIGMILKNTTDGSQTTVTDNDATTMTGVLSGGTDNDWDASDAYHVQDTDFKKSTLAHITLFNQSAVDRIIIQNAGGNTTDIENGNMWYALDEDSAPIQILDPQMPGNNGNPMIRGAVSLNAHLYVADVFGNINGCDLDDVTLWSVENKKVAERDSNPGVYLGKQKDHVVFFSTSSIEFFYDAANAAPVSPLTRREDVYYNIGCSDVNSIIDTGDEIIFAGQGPSGDAGIYMLKNFGLQKISSPLMDTICARIGFTNPTFASADFKGAIASLVNVPESGLFYVLTLDGSSTQSRGTYAMHIDTGFVSKWYTGSNPTVQGTDNNWATSFMLPLAGNTRLPGDNPTSVNVYMLYNGTTARLETFEDAATTNNLTDLGLTAPFCGYYSPPIDFNTNNRKRQHCLRVVHHPSVDDNIDPSNITIAWKNLDTLEAGGFDRDSFPTGRTIDLSKSVGRMYRGGRFRQRMYEVELTPNKRQIIKGLELEYDILRG